MESDRAQYEEDKRQFKEALERIAEDLRRQNAEQRELLTALSESWRADCERHHEETINAIRSTANEQVPFNVQGYINDFTRALSTEVRTLLGEVGRIREEKRALQHEVGALLSTKAMYAPGGEFEPDWKPPRPPRPPPGIDVPPPPMPDRLQRRGSWSTWAPDSNQVVTPPSVEPTLVLPGRGSPGTPSESSLRRGSWAAWEPDRNQAVTPPSEEIIPGRGSPGLFGTPSELSTDWKSPGSPGPPGTDMPPPMPEMPDVPPPIKSAWRTVHPRSKKKNTDTQAHAQTHPVASTSAPLPQQVVRYPETDIPPLIPDVPRMTETREPDRNQVVTPSVELIPERGSPGLFGTPSESPTDWKPPGSPGPPTGTDKPPPIPDVPQITEFREPDPNQVVTPASPSVLEPTLVIPGSGNSEPLGTPSISESI